MGQLRILKGDWGLMGQAAFKEGDVIDDAGLPDQVVNAAVRAGKAERVAKTETAAPKAAGGTR